MGDSEASWWTNNFGRDVRIDVLDAMAGAAAPVPSTLRAAYGDHPCRSARANYSQPYIVGFAAQAADPQPKQRALEVGRKRLSGSGARRIGG